MYILVLIISPGVSLSKKYHGARWCFVCTLVPFGVFPSEFPTLSGSNAQSVKSDVFYRASWHPRPGSPDLPTLSRIHARRALWPADGATRPKSTR